jgi:hypothetical protein
LNKLVELLGCGEVPERPKGVDCKSIGYAFAGSNPALATILHIKFDMAQSVKDIFDSSLF